MKKSAAHIVFPFLLVANLLFGQIGINFLHNPHSEHEPTVKVQSDAANVHQHGEHCKVCALDNLFNLLIEPVVNLPILEIENTTTSFVSSEASPLRYSSVRDRAPPVLS